MGRKLIYALLAVASVASIWVIIDSVERYEEEVDRGWSRVALRNPFLAAEQFLRAHDLPVRNTDRIDLLENLSVDASIVVQDLSLVSSFAFASQLEAWITAGGHAIVEVPWHEEGVAFNLLFRVNKYRAGEYPGSQGESVVGFRSEDEFAMMLRRRSLQREGADIAERLRRIEANANPDRLTHVNVEDDGYELFIDFSDTGFLHLDTEEPSYRSTLAYQAGSQNGPTFMQLAVGDGMLTAVSSVDIWRSEQIGIFDHAYLLLGLVDASDEVIFFTDVRSASLLEMIWTNFSELVLVVLIGLLAWVVYRARRFGPVLTGRNEERRSFMEHIQAVGHFMWRQRRSEDLLEAVREDVWLAARRRFQINDGLSDTERLAVLMPYCHLDYPQLQRLMYGAAPDDELQFLNMIKSLQEIRKAL